MSIDHPPTEVSLADARDRQRLTERALTTERVLQAVGVAAIVLHRSSRQLESITDIPLGSLMLLIMISFSAGLALRYYWSVERSQYWGENRAALAVCGLWLIGVIVVLLTGGSEQGRFETVLDVSEAAVLLRAAVGLVFLIRWISSGGRNPAFILAVSFLVLVVVGTGLLMLPRARAAGSEGGAPFHVALFTATSASCVTGLIVVDTSSYWSPIGQAIIMCLFQIGGLGIMTCGSLFALVSARRLQVRETAFLADMLEMEGAGAVRRLMIAIVIFTAIAELAGAAALWGLWPDEFDWKDRAFYSLFHSISAFCNAGFALMSDSFVGFSGRWQTWCVLPGLIIVGGLGFAVLSDLGRLIRFRYENFSIRQTVRLPRGRVRLSGTTWLVLTTTVGLLLWGACGFYILESDGLLEGMSPGEKVSACWFQSVTFRTAGFNTVDMGALQPGTKFFSVMLMFVGASPGSTGGGIKTISFALSILAVVSLLKGRDRIELRGRMIPDSIVKRALMIVALGIVCVLTTTLLIVVIESEQSLFLDHLFEATSAFATVGVSSIDTATLKPASHLVIVVAMFIGRVGPLTLLVGLAGKEGVGRYTYPEERVQLG